MSRPRKPKRPPGLCWIYAKWRDTNHRWEWCPARRIDGKLVWGASHADPQHAFEAAQAMEGRRQVVANVGDVTLQQACKRAVEKLIGNGGSAHTATGYETKFGRWFEILSKDAPIISITADDVEHLKVERRKLHGANNNTIRTDLVIMQRVFDLSGLRGDSNPVRNVERPKAIEPNRPFLTMDDVRSIAARIRASDAKDREWHATVVTFLAMTGARAFEIERIREHHVEEAPGGGCCVVLHGSKGSKVRRVYVAPGLVAVAREFVRGAKTAPPMAPVTIATICKRWARVLGERRLNGRVLRRTYATEMARHAPLHYVMDSLGHSQLTTTRKYLGIDPRLAQVAAAQLHSALVGKAPRAGRPRRRKRGGGSATRGTPATPPATRPDVATPSSGSRDPIE